MICFDSIHLTRCGPTVFFLSSICMAHFHFFPIALSHKVRSDGAQEMVTYQEMISQYTDTTVTYDQTDAAIYLPEEFLRVSI